MREVSTKRVNVAGIDYSFGDQLGKGSQPGRGFKGFGRWAGSSGYSSPTKSPFSKTNMEIMLRRTKVCVSLLTMHAMDHSLGRGFKGFRRWAPSLQWGLSVPDSPQWRAHLYSAPTKSPIIFSSPRPTSRYLQFMPWTRTRYLPENPPCYYILDFSSSCIEEKIFTIFNQLFCILQICRNETNKKLSKVPIHPNSMDKVWALGRGPKVKNGRINK